MAHGRGEDVSVAELSLIGKPIVSVIEYEKTALCPTLRDGVIETAVRAEFVQPIGLDVLVDIGQNLAQLSLSEWEVRGLVDHPFFAE